MSSSGSRRETCRLCDRSELELALSLEPTPVADVYVSRDRLGEVEATYPLDLFLCQDCGHLQMLDVVDPDVLFSNYTFRTSSSLGLVEHFHRGAKQILEQTSPDENALVVEIGSNDGSLLAYYKEEGMRVLGVDPARQIAKEATESGVETLPRFFSRELALQIRKERGPATIIVANNVYAHSDELRDMTLGIRELLSENGVFVFEVSYVLDMVDKMLFDTIYHEHLSYHAVKPLQLFFESLEMELIDVERIPTKGGSIRGTVQCAGGPRKSSASVPEHVELEESRGLARVDLFRDYAGRIDRVKKELAELLGEYRSRGKTIAGYGSSHTVNTLLHHFQLESFLEFVVDDNPSKQGLFTPGHHLPVVSPEALYEGDTDCVVILAWNYAKPIMKKHQKFLDRGGVFVSPLPEVKTFGQFKEV